jgi:hypothetical protein
MAFAGCVPDLLILQKKDRRRGAGGEGGAFFAAGARLDLRPLHVFCKTIPGEAGEWRHFREAWARFWCFGGADLAGRTTRYRHSTSSSLLWIRME